MHLEKLFQLYLEQAKKRVLTLLDNERTRACQWIKKIELAPNPEEQDKKLLLHSLKLLLLSLESNCLIGPFEEPPSDDKEFTQYDWEAYQLSDFSNMIRSKRETSKRPEVSYAVSGNRRELVTYQDDPATGQHCYYACSKQPIEEWKNLQGGVIKNDSIDQWKEHGEFEELNRKESQNSSIDIPRCVMHSTNSGVELNLNDERYSDRNPSRCQRIQNSSNNSNCVTPGPSRLTNYHRTHTGRPETPQRFGGVGRQTRPYEIEQFELSQNEQFRSPRGVFQNLNYDRFQENHRSQMPQSRLTDQVIESFENARLRRCPLSEEKHNDAKQKLCARLQTIRDGMNKKPQVEIEQQIEVEPEIVPYERITLQEPCQDSSSNQETEQDLGILSAGDMDDEILFGDHQTIDPRTIFKTKDENLVSRNVVKMETNTTINGSKREVTEEVFEQEDINVVERAEEEDENLVDVSEPTFQSPSGHSPLQLADKYDQWKSKPRRIPIYYSDLPQENLEDISKPSLQQESFHQENEGGKLQYIPRKQNRFCSTSIEESRNRLPTHVDGSKRLEDIFQPVFESSLEDSISMPLPEEENLRSINQRRSQQVDQSRRVIRPELSSNVNESERFNNVCQPNCTITSRLRRGIPPQVEASERLEEVSQPSFLHSTEVSCQDSTRKSRCPLSQRPLRQVETSEILDHVSHPVFLSSIEESYQDSSRRNRCPPKQRAMPQVETSEKLDEVSQPGFLHSTDISYQDSTRRTRCPTTQRPLPQVETSERLDQVSHPEFLSSMENTYEKSTKRTKCPSRQREMPQVETSERLDQVSHPSFLSSIEDTIEDSTRKSGCPSRQRDMPQVYTSERLDQISHPSFSTSFQESSVSSRRDRCKSPSRRLPQVETSERLDEISQPRILNSTQISCQVCTRRTKCPTSQRPLPQVETSERLDQVSHPAFLSSMENTFENSTRRTKCPSRQRGMPQVETSEKLDEVSQPGCLHSTDVSYQDSSGITRCPTRQRPLPPVDTSERLDQVSHPRFLSSMEDTYQDSTKRTKCPSRQKGMPQMETSERLDHVSHPIFFSSIEEDTYEDSTRRSKCPPRQRAMPQLETSEELDEVSQPGFLHSTDVSYQDSTRRTRCPTSQRPLPQVETSERLDQVSHPRFLSSIEDTIEDSTRRSRSPRQRAMPQVDTSERLDEISQPRILHSTKISCQDCTRRTKCPTSQRPLPQVETSEMLDQVSHPGFLSSIENTYEDSARRCKTPLSNRALPSVETSEQLDQVREPSFINSSVKSRGAKGISPYKPLPELQTCEHLDQVSHPKYFSCTDDSRDFKNMQSDIYNPKIYGSEMLDEVCQPEFQTSYEDSSLRSRAKGQILVPGVLPHVDVSEWLDDVCHPEYPTSFQTSSIQNTGISRRTPTQNRFLPVDESERLENICQPEFPSSFEDNIQQSRRQTQDRHSFAQKNVSEKLDDVSQPFYRSSFEDSVHRSSENKHESKKGPAENDAASEISSQICQRDLTPKEVRNTLPSRPFPQVNESEILDAIIQPDLTSFQDTGYGSKDSLPNVSQRHFSQIEEMENLEDVSQPNFQSSYGDSTLRSRENRCTLENRPLPFVNTSERLDDICQPDYPTAFEMSIRSAQSTRQPQKIPLANSAESEKLDNVCQPSFQTSFEDSNRRPNQTIHTPHHSDFQSSFRESCEISRRSKQNPRQRLLSRANTSEILDDISQPFHPSSFEDSIYDRRNRYESKRRPLLRGEESEGFENIQPDCSLHRPFHQVNESEHLDNVTQPDFQSSLESARHTLSTNQRTPQRRPQKKMDTSEKLNDVSQPIFPTSFGDSMKNSARYMETPKQRPLPIIDVSEKLEDVCNPSFVSSFEESSNKARTCEKIPLRRPFSQVDESEQLDDVSQPSGFPSSFKHSTAISRGSRLYPSQHTDDSEKPYSLKNSKQLPVRIKQSLDNRPFPQIDTSERLNDICQPNFENTVSSSMCPLEQTPLRQFSKHKSARSNLLRQQKYHDINVSERLDDVCQPSFPNSLEDSMRNSRRNESRPNQKSFSREMQQNVDQPDVSCSLDRSGGNSRRLPVQMPHQFDTSEMLDACAQPEFPSTFEGSTNISRRTGVERRAMPEIDLSENIESVCQPEFAISFEDSTSNNIQNAPSTYRKDRGYGTNLPKENLADISAPTFHSNYEDSMQRGRGNLNLPQENLEDVSCPSFQTTPKLPQRLGEDHRSRGPPRQLFPKQDSSSDRVERPGDFRKVFESMPNYAPFEQQVASKRNPIASKLKMPATFDNTMAPCKFCKTEMAYPRPRLQPSQADEMATENFHARIRPQIRSQVNPPTIQRPTNRNQMEPRPLAPIASSTRIPLPPSARSQANAQRQDQRSKIETPANQERLVKKSSVKFHQTKSTYFKNKQDKPNRNQNRR